MTWTYTGNPSSSPKDMYRFIIGDTLSDEPILQDEEILYVIDASHDNELLITYTLFSRAATYLSRQIKRKLGPQSEDPTERLKYYNSQVAKYKGDMDNSNMGLSLPRANHPQIFHIGQFSNPPWPKKEGNR